MKMEIKNAESVGDLREQLGNYDIVDSGFLPLLEGVIIPYHVLASKETHDFNVVLEVRQIMESDEFSPEFKQELYDAVPCVCKILIERNVKNNRHPAFGRIRVCLKREAIKQAGGQVIN